MRDGVKVSVAGIALTAQAITRGYMLLGIHVTCVRPYDQGSKPSRQSIYPNDQGSKPSRQSIRFSTRIESQHGTRRSSSRSGNVLMRAASMLPCPLASTMTLTTTVSFLRGGVLLPWSRWRWNLIKRHRRQSQPVREDSTSATAD